MLTSNRQLRDPPNQPSPEGILETQRRGNEQILTFRVPYRPGPVPFLTLLGCLAALAVLQDARSWHTLLFAIVFLGVGLGVSYVFDQAQLSLGPDRLRLKPPGLFSASKEIAKAGLRGVKVVLDKETGHPRVVLEHREGPVDLIELRDEALARDLATRLSRWLSG
jgi:hypothetical protein